MNERLPYEEQLAGRLADIPLPDEDKGWDAMRKMLDDDDDDGIVPPPVNMGCRRWGLGLLLVLLIGGITWGVYKMVDGKKNNKASKNSGAIIKEGIANSKNSTVKGNRPKNDTAIISTTQDSSNRTLQSAKASVVYNAFKKGDSRSVSFKKEAKKTVVLTGLGKTNGTSKAIARFGIKNSEIGTHVVGSGIPYRKKAVFDIKNKGNIVGEGSRIAEKGKKANSESGIVDSLNRVVVKGNRGKNVDETGKENNKKKDSTETSSIINAPTLGNKTTLDTAKGKTIDTLPIKKEQSNQTKKIKKDSAITNPSDDDSDTKNKIYLSAGLALQQLIPVDGQKSSPYNAFGRKGSLADYIPSAYFRAHLNRAFLQIEFKYGAPQLTKDIAYSTKVTNYDSTTHVTTSQVNHVNKTYYHQLPLSIHYEVLPNLSIGAGAIWNKFQSAVVTQQNQAGNGLTGTDSITSSKVINVKSDSAFAKTYWQFMLETQYAWRRFSFGARYAWGLTPYLTATSSSGQTQKERNASLNVFIRYELWKSKKK